MSYQGDQWTVFNTWNDDIYIIHFVNGFNEGINFMPIVRDFLHYGVFAKNNLALKCKIGWGYNYGYYAVLHGYVAPTLCTRETDKF